LLSRKRDQDAPALKEAGLISDSFLGNLWVRKISDHDLISSSPGRSEERRSKRKVGSRNICAVIKGEEFLGLLVSLEEILGELKNILLGFVLNSKGSSDDNICSLKNCYT
jgi:hypothetical protein